MILAQKTDSSRFTSCVCNIRHLSFVMERRPKVEPHLYLNIFVSFSVTASYVSNPICKGCLSCSKDNGCSRCQQKLFFFLRREGMRQYGECLHSCPSGYYGHRAPDMNRCASEYLTFLHPLLLNMQFRYCAKYFRGNICNSLQISLD